MRIYEIRKYETSNTHTHTLECSIYFSVGSFLLFIYIANRQFRSPLSGRRNRHRRWAKITSGEIARANFRRSENVYARRHTATRVARYFIVII